MKYISKKLYLIPAVSLLASALLYPRLPEQIPIHFDFSGNPDSFSGRWFIFVIPLLSVALLLMADFLPRIDPRSANYKRFPKAYQALYLGTTLLLNGCNLVIAGYTLGLKINISVVVTFLVGLLFLIFGNYMPKFKPNFFCGIRTPWCLSDPDNWNATHRFAGPLWMLCGLGMMLAPFLEEHLAFGFLLGLILIEVLVPYIYSYLYFRKHGSKGNKED